MTTAEKPCVICGRDCAGRPRKKDRQGRYACQDCVDARAAKKAGTPQPTRRATSAPEPEPDLMAGLLDGAVENAPTPCTNCAVPMSPDAVMCMSCGYNKATGKSASTAVTKVREKSEASAKAGNAASAAARTLGPMLWLVGGVVGGAIGAGIWAAIGYFTGYEISYVAIGVGVLVGFGVRIGAYGDASFSAGLVAAVIALASIAAGRLILVYVIFGKASLELDGMDGLFALAAVGGAFYAASGFDDD